MTASASQIDSETWAPNAAHRIAQARGVRARRYYYVVDNSGSMGTMTKQVQDIFSEMVDTVATAPCSMTVFQENAEILSSSITSGKQIRALVLPRQGMTNIPAGIQKALRVPLPFDAHLTDCEARGEWDGDNGTFGKMTKNQGKFREKSGKNQGIYTSLFGGHPDVVTSQFHIITL